MKAIFTAAISSFLICTSSLKAQPCIETTQYPTGIIAVPQYMDSIIVANDSYAGDFFEVNGFVVGKNYTFKTSASPDDYISITTTTNTPIASGPSPLSILITGSATLRVHISLVSPPCGDQALWRMSKVICNNCMAPANVGIGTNNPANSAKLDISSTTQALKVPTMTTTQRNNIVEPVEGLVMYNSTVDDLNIYDGTNWKNVNTNSTNLKFYTFKTADLAANLAGFALSVPGTIVFNGGGFTTVPKVFVGDIDLIGGTSGELYRVQLILYACTFVSGTTTCQYRLLNTSPNPVNYSVSWNCVAIGN
jgi:hypothetical protein